MRVSLIAVAVLVCGYANAPLAHADCVDYSQPRADRAAAALRANPPSAAALGMPTLEGLTLDALRTTGDPVCDGPVDSYYYTTDLTMTDFVTGLGPFIRRRTELDGMNRLWFENPNLAGRMFVTSGTEIEVQTSGDGRIILIEIDPADSMLALTPDDQPYSVEDIVSEIPWPYGGREFIRADQGAVAAPAPQQTGQQSAPATQEAQATCPPRSGGSSTAGNVGAEIGGAILGGSAGRSAGRALGGLFGGRRGSSDNGGGQADPDCPE